MSRKHQLRHFNYPSDQALLNQTFWSFSLQFSKTLMGLLTSLPVLQFNKGVWRSVNATDAGAGEERRVGWRAYADKVVKAKLGFWDG
jgi:hypothetical protein